jgi:dipeptidyl-peptidase 4
LPSVAAPSENLGRMLRRLFSEQEFQGKSFGPARWVESGRAYTTVEPASAGGSGKQIVQYDSESGERTVLVPASQLISPESGKPFEVGDYTWSRDGRLMLLFTDTHRVWRRNTKGSYWVLDRKKGSWRKLGGKESSPLMFAKLSPDGSRVAYVRDNNIYVENLDHGAIRQLTSDGSERIINGTSDWVYEEEFSLRDGFRWSPDGESIAFWQFDTSNVAEFALVNYTDSLYPVIQKFPYPKAGQTNSAVRVGVVRANGGKTVWMKVPGDPRNNYIARMEWAENSSELVLEHLNRLQNTNGVLLASARNGHIRLMFEDRDDAWLDVVDKLEWTNDGRLLWMSERDGWRRAYTLSRDGQARPLTRESTDILSIAGLDQDGGWLYYIASPDNATQRYLYRAPLDGSRKQERVTQRDAPGAHAYDISPDGRWAFHTYSRFDRPPVTDLVRLPEHLTVRTLEDNAELRSKTTDLIGDRAEFFQVDVDDGVTLDGWMIRPRNFEPANKYPTLVYVYGEPAATTVVDRWFGATTLFHAALADEGYLVVSFDNRGTPAPKGRAWRKVVYGAVGVLSAKEQAAALRALAETRPYVDLSRVAVWGKSGGGSNTLNLMFRSPDLYKVGISVAPVPDQRLYDTIYQERYMGLPQENAEGYQSGSPIHFAEGLKGQLLLIHGTGDDNVHFQGTQRLINRLVELGKPFDFMEYPNRTHALSEGPGTRLHLHTLIARYLIEHLPAGGRPR